MKEFVNDRAEVVEISSVEASRHGPIDLNATEVYSVSGGNVFNLIGAFRLGWDIGTEIDRRFIGPLWH